MVTGSATPEALADSLAEPGAQLRIASYNIHSCVGLDRRCRPARIATVLRELNCHIVALQEVDNVPGQHADSMQLDYLAHALEMTSIAGLRIVRHTGEYGNALLTRLPIRDVQRHDLSYSRYEPRGALDVSLELAGHEVRVIATHLGLNRAERAFQWQRLLPHIESADPAVPLMVLGDMNEWYRSASTLRTVHGLLGAAPAPVAFPSYAPCLALTRIWVRPLQALQSLTVHRSATARRASDHLPLVAGLSVRELFASEKVGSQRSTVGSAEDDITLTEARSGLRPQL
jgi:endonuclease/exonuclease/phosphatase family metal-dependent hydrolase